MKNKGFVIWNSTDDFSASEIIFNTRYDAEKYITQLREGYKKTQGFYYDSKWNMIRPEDIKFDILELK